VITRQNIVGRCAPRMLVGLLLLVVPLSNASSQSSPSGKRMSRPDSLRALPNYGVTDTTHVETRPITLREIIARAIEGEKTKLEGRQSLSYTMTVRSLALWDDKKKEIEDIILMAYTEASGYSKFVELNEHSSQYEYKDGNWVLVPDKTEMDSSVRVASDGYADFTELPFFLEEQAEFDFELLGRTIEVDHVIFEIGFAPKSDFKPLPSGTIFIDTNDYRIIHEEFHFAQNPFPLLLKGLNHMSRHWERLPTGEWVFTHVLADVELRGGYFGMIPDRVQFSLERSDFVFDEPYNTHLFGER
jgi:hypothetical protein